MARGPFQGTFQANARPTVVTAPDTLVYINGEADVIGCSSCRRKFDLNQYITSVQVNLNVDSPPGSASISLSVPRHTINDLYFDGNPIVTPMMEVEIYAKGYYLVEGLPQYYPIFWGLITEVGDNYSGGEHTIDIQCSDILKWWELCRVNVNAAWTVPSGSQGRGIFGNTFYGTNPYDVIWTLAQSSFGDVVVGTGSLINFTKENQQSETFRSSIQDMMLYWERRFRRIRSNLLLYGVNGTAIRGDTLYASYPTAKGSQHFVSTAVANGDGGPLSGQSVFDPTSPQVTAFRTQFANAAQVNFWQSEYQTKLELANTAKEAIGFEFYMDVTGDIVFKPPFYNMDILSNKPLSWIQDIDIIDWAFSESEAEVVTQITMQGSYGGNIEYGMGEEATPYTTVTDYHLLRKYGWRTEPYNSEFMGDPQVMFYHGLDILDRKNSRRHHGSVTIPFRPELRLGFPIYIAPKDQVWYVSGISHNIAFGGRATTQLTLTAKRTKFIAPKGIATLNYKGSTAATVKGGSTNAIKVSSREIAQNGKFDLKLGGAASFPPLNDVPPGKDNPYDPLVLRHPKTGRIVGYPNAVMVYTRPFSAPSAQLAALGGLSADGQKKALPSKGQVKGKALANQTSFVQSSLNTLQVNNVDALEAQHSNNTYQYGLNSAGVYVYAYEPQRVVGEIVLMPAKNVFLSKKDSNEATPLKGATSMIRPVSDERGFEVIGHFRYGRGVALRDGRLVLNGAGNNLPASVDVQLALAGGLQETLAAQSQGLTAITSAYANPADAVARMQPEDLQTAGVISPTSTEPIFVPSASTNTPGSNDINFVDTRPLGSPQDKGTPVSVEAGQLSRALTIAEMSATEKNDAGSADCVCITGRSDLAFINVGYQLKTLNSSSPAQTVTGGGAAAAQTTANIANSATGNDAVAPVAQPTMIPKSDELESRVNTFLWNLYSSLDKDHQAEETILRTGTANPPADSSDATGPNSQQYSDLAPPFNAPGRYNVGDPKAFLGQIESNVKGIDTAYATLGANLKNNAKRTSLSQKIANNQSEINQLSSAKATLLNEIANGSHASITPNLQDQVASLDTQIAKQQQDLANNQAALGQLGST